MPRTTLEFELPDRLDEAAALALMAARLDVRIGRALTGERDLLDTFDARLRAAGLRAECPTPTVGRRQLTLLEAGMPTRRGDVPNGPAVAGADLPPGPLRDRLIPVLDGRALLPVARVRSRTAPVAVLNGDGKTVVRLTLERATVGPTALGLRLVVEPVRGYERHLDRVVRRLRDGLSLVPATVPLYDAAVIAAGGRPQGLSSKVDVALEPGTPADVAAGRVLLRLVDIARANVPGVLDDLDPEFLHDLRVAVRRARSVLRELAEVLTQPHHTHLRRQLTWVQALTGPVRDLDVQLADWGELAASPDGDLEPLRGLLVRRRRRELAVLRRGLQSRRFDAAMETWRALATSPPAGPDRAAADQPPTLGQPGTNQPSPDQPGTVQSPPDQPGTVQPPIEVVAARRIRKVYARIVRDGRRIDASSPDEELHDLRKRGKELRYLLELFGSLYPPDVVQSMVGALKGLQDVLGRFQDRSVQAELLRVLADELAALPDGPRAVLAAGLVVSGLEADQRRARRGFAARFEAFASKEQQARVRDTFEEVGRV